MNNNSFEFQNIHLVIKLVHIEPSIWRRIIVPSFITLLNLHDVIQVVMDWTRSHKHEFIVDGITYGTPHKGIWGSQSRVLAEGDVRLHDIINEKDLMFTYVYDFGDNWVHEIVVEEILKSESGRSEAHCLGGERSCPPEDIGGPFSYPGFLKAIADPTHAEHDHFLEWLGDEFDPEAFNFVRINEQLKFMAEYWE
jgi:hypothetical protein